MVKPSVGASGFSLIELMIVMVIMGILALVVAPFTQNWVDETRVINANNALKQAWSQAKSLALRNPKTVTGTDAAAEISIETDKIFVCPEQCTNATRLTSWAISIPAGVLVEFTSPDVDAIALSNAGAALAVVSGVTVELPEVSYRVVKGGVNETSTLY